ncbi:hypothetical protein O5D80_003126 [Batrachochytrium dendrobatidis]|nr:hypothetical protein O5D80_003126 [Batrachochytrium dendrobatidis]
MLDKDVDVVVPSGETGSFTQTPSTSPLYSHQPAKPTHHAKFTSYPGNYHRVKAQVTVSTPETSSFGGEIM